MKLAPVVYYIHEVCQSCTNLAHDIVLQEQWILASHDILFHKLSKTSIAVWETYPACEELYLMQVMCEALHGVDSRK